MSVSHTKYAFYIYTNYSLSFSKVTTFHILAMHYNIFQDLFMTPYDLPAQNLGVMTPPTPRIDAYAYWLLYNSMQKSPVTIPLPAVVNNDLRIEGNRPGSEVDPPDHTDDNLQNGAMYNACQDIDILGAE